MVQAIRRTLLVGGILLSSLAQTRPADPSEAEQALSAQLAALKDVSTLHARFVCEKDLQFLEAPVLSGGDVWIRKATRDKDGAVRFTTTEPYRSEVILADGKVHGRSQHEDKWETKGAGQRPGLTAVMSQLGGWSTGELTVNKNLYAVARSAAAVPPIPSAMHDFATGAGPLLTRSLTAADNLDAFTLTPIDKDLAKSVKRVTLTLNTLTHELVSAEIETAQDDRTRYWFFAVQLNPTLAADLFKPEGAPGRFSSKDASP